MEQTYIEWDFFLQSKLTNMTPEERIEWAKSHIVTHDDRKLMLDFTTGQVVDYVEKLLN